MPVPKRMHAVEHVGYATRVFANHPVNGWQRILRGTVYLLVDAGGTVPEFAGMTFEVAIAHIETKGGYQATRVLRLEFARWRFNEDGALDLKFLSDQERMRYWPSNVNEMRERFSFSKAERDCIWKLLRLRKLLRSRSSAP